jgi:hypothetical protein
MQRTRLKRWQLTPREYWLHLALWLGGTLLVTHYLLHGGSTLGWFVVLVTVGVFAYGVVIAARFLPGWHRHRL